MEFSITRLEQVAKILAEEIKEQLTEKQGINEMEQVMRELVREAAGLGIRQAIEQSEERYASKQRSSMSMWRESQVCQQT